MAGVGNADVPVVSGGRSQKVTKLLTAPLCRAASHLASMWSWRYAMETRANFWTRVSARPWSTSTISSHRGCCFWMSENRQKSASRRSRLLMEPRTSGVCHSATWRERNCRHSDQSLSCRRCRKCGVSLHLHLETLWQAHQQVYDARTLFRRDQWWKSCRHLLGVSGVKIVPTGAGSFAMAMITDSEVYHMLKVGHQEDVRRNVCNFGD